MEQSHWKRSLLSQLKTKEIGKPASKLEVGFRSMEGLVKMGE
jgi:hypothetical protein